MPDQPQHVTVTPALLAAAANEVRRVSGRVGATGVVADQVATTVKPPGKDHVSAAIAKELTRYAVEYRKAVAVLSQHLDEFTASLDKGSVKYSDAEHENAQLFQS